MSWWRKNPSGIKEPILRRTQRHGSRKDLRKGDLRNSLIPMKKSAIGRKDGCGSNIDTRQSRNARGSHAPHWTQSIVRLISSTNVCYSGVVQDLNKSLTNDELARRMA